MFENKAKRSFQLSAFSALDCQRDGVEWFRSWIDQAVVVSQNSRRPDEETLAVSDLEVEDGLLPVLCDRLDLDRPAQRSQNISQL